MDFTVNESGTLLTISPLDSRFRGNDGCYAAQLRNSYQDWNRSTVEISQSGPILKFQTPNLTIDEGTYA